MAGNRVHATAWCREAFLRWARRAAVPLPVSTEEPLDECAQAVLDRLLAGKRFVFLGEPEHFIVEKYPFRLMFIRHLFARGWRDIAMETGRSVGWRVDRYLETGDSSYLRFEPAGAPDAAPHDRTLEFIDRHEDSFHEQLRCLSESRRDGTPRLRYWGYDLDLGVPLGAVKPLQRLLERHADGLFHEWLRSLDTLGNLSTDQQLGCIEALQVSVTTRAEALGNDIGVELQSWLSFLHDSVAAEKRPRVRHDPRGARQWWVERERFLMRYLDAIVAALGNEGKLVLLGHCVHLSKNATHLWLHPRPSMLWGWRSWLRAFGYWAFFKLTRSSPNMGDSVGAHVCRRFPEQVLSLWMLYGQGTRMTPAGPRTVPLRDDTLEALLARVGDRFLLPLQDMDPQARAVLSRANFRLAEGSHASADLTCQADALCFVKDIDAE